MKEYLIVDLIDSNNDFIWSKFRDTLRFIQEEDDIRNKKNYEDLEALVDQHLSFTVLVDPDTEDVVAFSGLYGKIYPGNIARAANRAYYKPEIRFRGMVPTKGERKLDRGLIARYMLPFQIKAARTRGVETVFVSVEFAHRRKSLETIVQWMNKYHDHDGEWELLKDMYFTCPTQYPDCYKTKTCWQNVAVMNLTEKPLYFPLEKMFVEAWKHDFGVGKK